MDYLSISIVDLDVQINVACFVSIDFELPTFTPFDMAFCDECVFLWLVSFGLVSLAT